MGERDLLCTVIAGFLQDSPKQVVALEAFLETGDVPGARRQAHTLKGAASAVGGEIVRKVAAGMEAAAHSGQLETVRRELPTLKHELERLHEALRTFQQSPSNPA